MANPKFLLDQIEGLRWIFRVSIVLLLITGSFPWISFQSTVTQEAACMAPPEYYTARLDFIITAMLLEITVTWLMYFLVEAVHEKMSDFSRMRVWLIRGAITFVGLATLSATVCLLLASICTVQIRTGLLACMSDGVTFLVYLLFGICIATLVVGGFVIIREGIFM